MEDLDCAAKSEHHYRLHLEVSEHSTEILTQCLSLHEIASHLSDPRGK